MTVHPRDLAPLPCDDCHDGRDNPQPAATGSYYCDDHMTARADLDDLDALADELVTEYAAAVDRIRDRAMEARYGGRTLRSLTVAPPTLYANLSDAERLALAESLATE